MTTEAGSSCYSLSLCLPLHCISFVPSTFYILHKPIFLANHDLQNNLTSKEVKTGERG